MKFLLRSELIFAAVLVVSLGGKILLNDSDESLAADGPKFAQAVAMTLNQQGFVTKATFWPTGPQVEARRGDCFMWVRDYTAHGTLKNIVMVLAEPVGKLRYSYRGKISDEPPKVLPLMHFFLRREVARIGTVMARYPIYAVAANNACSLDQVQLPQEV